MNIESDLTDAHNTTYIAMQRSPTWSKIAWTSSILYRVGASHYFAETNISIL